jgi:homotetrameric cytidine deaminase
MKVPAKISVAYEKALAVRLKAHAPYSKFQVGAALVGRSVVTGCNVENASYGGTVCAERIAIFKAVSEGVIEGATDIVVVTDAPEPAFPCAFCLQVMAEFFEPSLRVWLGDLKGVRSMHTFGELLPHPFGPKQLGDARVAAKAPERRSPAGASVGKAGRRK